MKRLFMLRHGKGGSAVKDDDGSVYYFGNKMQAKFTRDYLQQDVVVSFGPDHKLYKGN